MKIVIAGGTGLIGKQLEIALSNCGHEVLILTRSPKKNNHIQWNPYNNYIELDKITDVEAIINLCGSGIADSRWTAKRRKELEDSRILPAVYLAELTSVLKQLKFYITASGITCFGFNDIGRLYTEDDVFGKDYTSQLVKKWEDTLNLFPKNIQCSALRFGIVLSDQGGAIPRISQPIKFGAGAALGSGKQIVQWLDIDEIPNIVEHFLSNSLEGTFNVLQGNVTNKELTKSIAKSMKRWVLPINVPSIVMKAIFGEMSVLLLEGVPASNKKLLSSGFTFQTEDLGAVIAKLNL